ncbi:O-methyltransferase [Colletotrichum orchidophilum]|uniref:O-methyltransferase n=1 Tax=Colletotrichum orchidophilum TaxID=1209926 RepID=A0A1G4AME4_9PEZI|nr:O-methyltransferase [Colletotrichum orchidophilum]OHE90255.1 O-methyltransferase [Colletotrichum orchidophilum]
MPHFTQKLESVEAYVDYHQPPPKYEAFPVQMIAILGFQPAKYNRQLVPVMDVRTCDEFNHVTQGFKAADSTIQERAGRELIDLVSPTNFGKIPKSSKASARIFRLDPVTARDQESSGLVEFDISCLLVILSATSHASPPEFPHLKYIVQDLLETVTIVQRAFIADTSIDPAVKLHIQFMSSDFPRPRTVLDAHMYFLRMIMHDWLDRDARIILQKPSNGSGVKP